MRDEASRHNIPFEHFKFCISCNLFAGLTVHLADVDLQRPLIVAHRVAVCTVHRDRDCLRASVRAAVWLKADRYDGFVESEIQRGEFGSGCGNRLIDQILRFRSQLFFRAASRRRCRRVRLCLTGIRSHASAERADGSLFHGIVQAPARGCRATAYLITVVHRMVAGGHSLLVCRCERPCTAADGTGRFNGFDLDDCIIHLFAGLQTGFIDVYRIRSVKAAAGRLRLCRPVGVIVLIFHRRADEGDRLPAVDRGLINESVIITGRRIGGCTAGHQLIGAQIALCGNAVGIMLNDPKLLLVIRGFQRGVGTEKTKTQLIQPAPDVDLIGVVISGRILVCANCGRVGIGIRRAARRLAIRSMRAAVSRLAIEPNQPRSAHKGDGCDLAGGDGGCWARLVGGSTSRRLFHTFKMHREAFLERTAVRRGVDKSCGEIVIRLHIDACGRRRGFRVNSIQDRVCRRLVSRISLVVQQSHVVRKNDLRSAAVCRIFDLHHDGHDGKLLTSLPRHRDRQAIRIERFGIEIARIGSHLLILPRADADFRRSGCNRQTVTADVASRGRIRQIVIKHPGDLIEIGRRVAFAIFSVRLYGMFHRGLHSQNKGCQSGIGCADGFGRLVFIRERRINLIRSIDRCGGFVRFDNGRIQSGLQVGVFRVSLPRLTCKRPCVDSGNNLLSIQRFHRSDENLGFGAQFRIIFGGNIRNLFVTFKFRICAFSSGRSRIHTAVLLRESSGCGKVG